MTDDGDADDADATPDVATGAAEPDDEQTDAGTDATGAESNGEVADGGTGEEDADGEYGDETVPHVELELYQLSVRVSGQSTDELEDVEGSARRLMDFLVTHARQLEDEPDMRGLS